MPVFLFTNPYANFDVAVTADQKPTRKTLPWPQPFKKNKYNRLIKYKARLVIKGFFK